MARRLRAGLLYYLYLGWIVIRVGLVTVLWLGIILGTFVGYLTIPIIVVSIFLALYALIDAIGILRGRRGNGRKTT